MIHFLFNCMKICKSFVNTMKKLMFLLRPLAFDVNKSLICGMKFQCQSSLQTTTVTVYTHIIQIFNGQQYAHSRTTYPVRMLSNLFLRSCISNSTIIVQRGSVVYWPRVFDREYSVNERSIERLCCCSCCSCCRILCKISPKIAQN